MHHRLNARRLGINRWKLLNSVRALTIFTRNGLLVMRIIDAAGAFIQNMWRKFGWYDDAGIINVYVQFFENKIFTLAQERSSAAAGAAHLVSQWVCWVVKFCHGGVLPKSDFRDRLPKSSLKAHMPQTAGTDQDFASAIENWLKSKFRGVWLFWGLM